MKSGSGKSGQILIVGAGLAGLTAARLLADSGRQVMVIDKGRGVGGRLATRRVTIDDRTGVFDHGAQFFTVRDPRFAAMVSEWREAGIVREWSRGFPTPGEPYTPDGHPRYIGVRGMTALAKYLARGLDVRTEVRAIAVHSRTGGWEVSLESGDILRAEALILTPPVPQTLALLDAGQVELDPDHRRSLQSLAYEPCLALLVLLDGPSRIPAPGAVQDVGNGIAWIADNHRKDISPQAHAVTIHAGPDFSRVHWEKDEDSVQRAMLDVTQEYLGQTVLHAEVKRWRYAKPETIYPSPSLVVRENLPMVLAGDIFGGSRVEGAVLSGISAAESLMDWAV